MTCTPQGYIKAYCEALTKERGYAAHSVSAYQKDLLQLYELLQQMNVSVWSAVKASDLRQCVATLRRNAVGTRSSARKVSAWRGFFIWLHSQGVVTNLPTNGLRAPQVRSKPLPKALPIDVTQKMLDQPVSSVGSALEQALSVRDQAMFELLYASGLRVSELVSLDLTPHRESMGYLRPHRKNLRVRGKGSKVREVPVGNKAWQAIQVWLQCRSTLDKYDSEALFLGARGRRINRHEVARRLAEYGAKAGLKVSPHMLRHSFASHILQSSGNLRAVQELLGHQSLTSTQVYTALDIQHLNSIYHRSHPRASRRKK